MEKLYLLYDPKCELCERLKDWLLLQESWLDLCLVPADSEKVKNMFPQLEQIATCNDLVAISDNGDVYLNNSAWIMALYALEQYRDWSRRLAHPLLMPLVRQAFEAVSRNRHAISRWLRGARPEDIACELREVKIAPCGLPGSTVSDYLR
ncbi:MAG: DCC1-like thiol-disulfide oxidoreductase family protein [Actinomycetota bacterium]